MKSISSYAKKNMKGISDTQGEGMLSNAFCMLKMFVSVGFEIAFQKPEHAGIDTPNSKQSKLKLE